MPRTRSSRKPGCFSQVKPTLVFTDSPPEKLPRRLLSPLLAADNPVTARVVCVEDGLEASWVSPQFHGNALALDEPSKTRRRRQPRASIVDGKSSMASQHTTRARKPRSVALRRESTLATSVPGERRQPKGYYALQFVADEKWKKRSSVPQEVFSEDVRGKPLHGDDDDDDDAGIRLSEVGAHKSEMNGRLRKSRRKGTKKERNSEEEKREDGTDRHDDIDGCRRKISRDIAKERTCVRAHHPRQNRDSSTTGFSYDAEPSSCTFINNRDFVRSLGKAIPEQRFTVLKDGHHSVTEDVELPSVGHSLGCIEPDDDDDADDVVDAVKENLEIKFDQISGACCSTYMYQESPRFDRSKRPSFPVGGPPNTRQSFRDQGPSESGSSVGRCNEREHPLLSKMKAHRYSGLPSRSDGQVLVADTPEPEYGLRVSLRQRKALLPTKALEHLLLDS